MIIVLWENRQEKKVGPSSTTSYLLFFRNNYMVIVKSKLVKDYMKSPSISKQSLQTIYDLIVDNLQLVQIRCNECNQCGFVVHGYYDRRLKRYLKNGENSDRITILRIRCTHCGKTHAVLLSSMIPYSQLSVEDSISIIELEHNCQMNSFLDEHYWIETDDVFNTRFFQKIQYTTMHNAPEKSPASTSRG